MSTPAPAAAATSSNTFPFLRLPLELRESIYSLYFKPADRLYDVPIDNAEYDSPEYGGGCYRFDFRLYRVCKQIYAEAQTVWRRENVFIRIDTPWPTAVNHISSEGLVPIVVNGSKGDRFKAHHALVQIHAPFHQATPQYSIVVLLDDLYLFCQVWLYSSLSYPMLNERLSTTFILNDPYYPADPKPIPLSLQRRLLLPFEKVKGLYRVEVEGYDEQVKKELERRMAIPNPTVQQCCEECTTIMEQGDVALKSGAPEEALELYNKAFHAIHVLINGRTRRVLADGFFHSAIETGRFAGHSGMTVRVILRIKLVARVISAYLKQHAWGEAAFWGMRSIRIMREAIDTEFDEFLEEYVGGEDIGAIYLRTGIAFWRMEARALEWRDELRGYDGEDMADSERLFQLGAKYLRRKKMKLLKSELEEYGIRVPEDILRERERRKSEGDMASMAHLNLASDSGSAGSSSDE